MTRFIDADALNDDILKSAVMIDDRGIQTGYEIAIELIKRQPTIDAVPVVMIESRINGLKKMLIDIDSDDVDNIWALRTEIDTLTELLEMWAERKDSDG